MKSIIQEAIAKHQENQSLTEEKPAGSATRRGFLTATAGLVAAGAALGRGAEAAPAAVAPSPPLATSTVWGPSSTPC